MSRKVHPVGYRLGYSKTWLSKWFSPLKSNSSSCYGDIIHEDSIIRRAVHGFLIQTGAFPGQVKLVRTNNGLRVIVPVSFVWGIRNLSGYIVSAYADIINLKAKITTNNTIPGKKGVYPFQIPDLAKVTVYRGPFRDGSFRRLRRRSHKRLVYKFEAKKWFDQNGKLKNRQIRTKKRIKYLNVKTFIHARNRFVKSVRASIFYFSQIEKNIFPSKCGSLEAHVGQRVYLLSKELKMPVELHVIDGYQLECSRILSAPWVRERLRGKNTFGHRLQIDHFIPGARKFIRAPWFKIGIRTIPTALGLFSAEMLVNFIVYFIKIERKQIKIFWFICRVVEYSITKMPNITGFKIQLKGRLNGKPRKKIRKKIYGTIPLITLDTNLDYASGYFHNKIGEFGVKVWLSGQPLEKLPNYYFDEQITLPVDKGRQLNKLNLSPIKLLDEEKESKVSTLKASKFFNPKMFYKFSNTEISDTLFNNRNLENYKTNINPLSIGFLPEIFLKNKIQPFINPGKEVHFLNNKKGY